MPWLMSVIKGEVSSSLPFVYSVLNELFNMNFSSNIFTVTSATLTFLLVDVPIYKNFSSKLSSGNWLSAVQLDSFCSHYDTGLH